MRISLDIILDVLKEYNTENHINPDKKQKFRDCLPLPEGFTGLTGESLYVGCLSKALPLPQGICCICVRDRIKDEKETEKNLSGLVIVNENITQNELLLKISNRVFAIINWVEKMNEVLINNGTLQDLIDLCPPIIENYISINDASLMLLAYSKNVTCDDPICIELVKTGYHSDDYIRQFRKHNYLKTWEVVNDIVIDPSCAIAKYTTVYKVFRFHNRYFAQIIMTCNPAPVTPCLLELFQLFVDVVDKYFKRICENKSEYIHIYDTLLTDLIEKRMTKRKAIEERAQYVGLPLAGPYCLFLITPKDSANLSIGNMLKEFSELFPHFKFVTYNECIVAIVTFISGNPGDRMNTICVSMEAYVSKHDAQCSVSQFFSYLEDIPYAYLQAKIALKYVHLPSIRTLFHDLQPELYKRIQFYSDKIIYCMMDDGEGHAELWYHSDICRRLKDLSDYDQNRDSDLLELLNIYLGHGQNASEVANILGTHRNSIVYRINRIQEIMGIKLNQPSVRYILQTAMILCQMYGFGESV
jgi:sugar diacid utilization regulator